MFFSMIEELAFVRFRKNLDDSAVLSTVRELESLLGVELSILYDRGTGVFAGG
jgi:hypothetical protein